MLCRITLPGDSPSSAVWECFFTILGSENNVIENLLIATHKQGFTPYGELFTFSTTTYFIGGYSNLITS